MTIEQKYKLNEMEVHKRIKRLMKYRYCNFCTGFVEGKYFGDQQNCKKHELRRIK